MGRMVMEFFTFRMRRRMSNQRPRAAERPSADEDETVEDLVPPRAEVAALLSVGGKQDVCFSLSFLLSFT